MAGDIVGQCLCQTIYWKQKWRLYSEKSCNNRRVSSKVMILYNITLSCGGFCSHQPEPPSPRDQGHAVSESRGVPVYSQVSFILTAPVQEGIVY